MTTARPSSMTSNELLCDVRGRWDHLVAALAALRSTNPRKFAKGELGILTGQLTDALQVTTQRLKHPTLRIATLATGSAGKSTLVNALAGRKLVPMATGEMSAGHVLIRHAPVHRLTIAQTPGALWECGVFDREPGTGGLLNDASIYAYLKMQVMARYHAAVKRVNQSSPTPPSIVIEAPLLTEHGAALLGLPQGVGVEILDLPGLNTLDNDDHNFQEIRRFTRSAFCVFVLDYELTLKDQKHELLKHAKALSGAAPHPDRVLFVINKALFKFEHDLRDRTARLEELKADINAHLGLPRPVPAVPVEALAWYLIQAAFGPYPPSHPAADRRPPADRAALLEAFEQEYLMKAKSREGPNLPREWYRQWSGQFTELPDAELARFLDEFALPQSGATEFFAEIARRLEESFISLVVWPAVEEPLDHCVAYVARVRVLLETVRESQRTSMQQAIERVEKQIAAIRKEIRAHAGRFRTCLDALKEAIGAADDEQRNQAWLKVRALFRANRIKPDLERAFQNFARELLGDLNREVLPLLRVHVDQRLLAEVLPAELARELAVAWNDFQAAAATYGLSDRITVRVASTEVTQILALDDLCQRCRRAADLLRTALHRRASYFLQQRAFVLEAHLHDVVMQAGAQLEERVVAEIGEREAVKAVFAGIGTKSWHLSVSVPVTAIEIGSEPEQQQVSVNRTITEKKFHGKELVTTARKSIRIFGRTLAIPSMTVKLPWFGDVMRVVTEKYVDYSLLSPTGLNKEGSRAAQDAVATIAEVLTDGLRESTDAYAQDLDVAAEAMKGLVEEQLTPLKGKISSERAVIIAEWEALAAPAATFENEAAALRQRLQESTDEVA
jgi:hypothetical protein